MYVIVSGNGSYLYLPRAYSYSVTAYQVYANCIIDELWERAVISDDEQDDFLENLFDMESTSEIEDFLSDLIKRTKNHLVDFSKKI